MFVLAVQPFGEYPAEDPIAFRALFFLPVLGAIATIGVVAFAVQSWRAGYWGSIARVHYTLLALVTVAFSWLLYYWNLYPGGWL